MYSDRKIDLMIVGAQKSGTTSLKNYLGKHPQIATHLQTEFSYFLHEKEFANGLDNIFKKNFSDALQDRSKKIIAKSAGMYVNEEALQRLKASNPDCLVVLLMRNPVERAYSSYLMEINSGWFDEPWSAIKTSLQKFEKGEKDQMFRLFIEMGMYAEQLKKIYRCFPKERVLIFHFEDLSSDALSICKTIFTKLGIDDTFVPDTSQRYNPANRPRAKGLSKMVHWLRFNHNPVKRFFKFILPSSTFIHFGQWVTRTVSIPHQPQSMDPELQKLLSDFFRPYNKELEKMTGQNFDRWNQ
ncbi:MAG TPA: sulfotransferase [Chitinophagales bacterium]|nr:sulfotransferase [Chitinophagales bacterium]